MGTRFGFELRVRVSNEHKKRGREGSHGQGMAAKGGGVWVRRREELWTWWRGKLRGEWWGFCTEGGGWVSREIQILNFRIYVLNSNLIDVQNRTKKINFMKVSAMSQINFIRDLWSILRVTV